jgi:hypothetical protein
MRKGGRWSLGVGATFSVVVGCLSFLSASRVYEEAGVWFSRATYLAECVGSSQPAVGCAALAEARPRWPDGIPINNLDVLLAEASALHDTATGVLTLAGLFFALAGVLLAAFALVPVRGGVHGGERGTLPRLSDRESQLAVAAGDDDSVDAALEHLEQKLYSNNVNSTPGPELNNARSARYRGGSPNS